MVSRASGDGLESIRAWWPAGFPGLELLRATYVRQTFARHSHEGYAVGVIEQGALGFDYRGERLVAPAGAVNLCVPDEPHTGHAHDAQGWTYRMFYLDTDVMTRASARFQDRLWLRRVGSPFFRAGVLFDPELARRVLVAHQCLADPATDL